MIPDWEFGIREDELQKEVEDARSGGADLVVLLSHNGFDVDRKMAGRVKGIDVILTGHTHDALPVVVKEGNTLLIATGSHGKFVSRLDLDIKGKAIANFRYALIPVFADVIKPDAEMAAAIEKARAPFEAELGRVIGQTEALLYRRGNFNGTLDDLICSAMLSERDAQIALSPGMRWGASLLPGDPITFEAITNATAITYPNCYRTGLSGTFLKDVLEDVADNIFNIDPYYQQGGDMVRAGGLAYTIDVHAPIGRRISDMTLHQDRRADRSLAQLCRCRLGQHQRGHRRAADLGAGRAPCGRSEDGDDRREQRRQDHRLLTPRRGAGFQHEESPFEDDMSEPTPHRAMSRRLFLRSTGIAAAAAATTWNRASAGQPDPAIVNIPDYTRALGDSVEAHPYGMPSKFEAHVVKRDVPWLTASPQSSVNFTPLHELDGIITPNGLCFERHHAGIAEIDPAGHRLMINGLVDTPLVFTMDDIKRFPRENHIYFLECAANSGMEWRGSQLNGCQFTHGMIHAVMYTGVPLKYILEEAGVKTSAKWIMPEGADASAMNRSIPLEKALKDCLVAFKMNGEALRAEQGYPLRLVVPGWEGNVWVKWLRRIEVGDQPWQTREETSKYTDLLADGRSRRFTWIMDAKSVITSPSPQAPLKFKGANVLSGLAWSGRGAIKRVDVTLDGGRNWQTARLSGPVLPLAPARFYVEFDWQGQELMVQSRAMDDTGYVQPTKQELRQVRGTNSIYHNNGIQTWLVRSNGETENVEVS